MSRRTLFKFQLYIAGNAPNSTQAQANLVALCRAHLPDCHHIEVVDVFRQPQRALAEGIFMTPTLIKLWPVPVEKIVGTLSHSQPILDALRIVPPAA